MPNWQEATAMLSSAMRHSSSCKLIVSRTSFQEMKASGNFLFHADKKLLEYAHPTGTVWICAGAPELTEARAFEWRTDDLIRVEHTGEAGRLVRAADGLLRLEPHPQWIQTINNTVNRTMTANDVVGT